MRVHELFKDYTKTIDGEMCYFAGLPGYPRNFSRDTLIAGIIAADRHLLDNQLTMSSRHQGTKYDPLTGEEPGKIHHEWEGVIVRDPYYTTYNACDTTGLYLTGLEILEQLGGASSETVESRRKNIESALDYIQDHTRNGIFWEYPPEGSTNYSLRVTNWKDSVLPIGPEKVEPRYPASYAIAHFQNARGVLAAGNLLDSNELRQSAHDMFVKGIGKFIVDRTFIVMEDNDGNLEQSSSDELHSLAYIPKTYRDQLPLDAIRQRADSLITDAGIACTPADISAKLTDTYHGNVVWMFEQALIHYGASKFGMNDVADITKRCIPHIGSGQELVDVSPTIQPRGNGRQLWSVAAKIYFSDEPSLRQTDLL